MGENPLFFRGHGPYLIDADDNRYIDYVGAFGPLILGHSHEHILSAIENQLKRGINFGASTAEIDIQKDLYMSIQWTK